ncbi:lysine--tRNA ligase [Tanacetum coccineum]
MLHQIRQWLESSSSYEKPSFVNDHDKHDSSLEKEESDGSILVQPMGYFGATHANVMEGVVQHNSGPGIGVTEEVRVLDLSLGSYASKTSTTEKTQDTQRQNQPILARVTRSRSSTQQISGINKPSKLSASYKLQKGEDAVPHFVDASNKLVDAVETSQRLSDKIGETQAISSNDGVLKPVISSNIAAPRVTQSWATDVPTVVQPVDSSIKLVPITLCMASEGLVSTQSSDCCMIVKPKQLNFDEIEECDLDETCSPLSKKRKMDDANALSSSPKAADTLSDNNFDDLRYEELNDMANEHGDIGTKDLVASSLRKYENLENGEHRDGEQESLADRVRNIRCSSYVTFFDLHGPGGKVQVMVYRRRPELDKSEISKFQNSVNGGDILGIVVFPGKSLKGELSIFLKTLTVLTSCLRTPQKAKVQLQRIMLGL